MERYAEMSHRRRAASIAQTELAYAYNNGQQALVEESIKDGTIAPGATKIWYTAADERVCSQCGSMDMQEVPIDAAFSNGVKCPPAHLNCRCTVAFKNLKSPAPQAKPKPEPTQAQAQIAVNSQNGLPKQQNHGKMSTKEEHLHIIGAKTAEEPKNPPKDGIIRVAGGTRQHDTAQGQAAATHLEEQGVPEAHRGGKGSRPATPVSVL